MKSSLFIFTSLLFLNVSRDFIVVYIPDEVCLHFRLISRLHSLQTYILPSLVEELLQNSDEGFSLLQFEQTLMFGFIIN